LKLASEGNKLTATLDSESQVSVDPIDFGFLLENYSSLPVADVAGSGTGKWAGYKITKAEFLGELKYFTVSGSDSSWKVYPEAGLAVGSYEDTLTVMFEGPKDTDETVTARAQVRIVVSNDKTPAERAYFTKDADDCEIVWSETADGKVSVRLRVPFQTDTTAADAAKVVAVRARISGALVTSISYAYADASGKLTPINAQSARGAAVAAPYLQISFTVANVDALKACQLDAINYWLEDGPPEGYVQTYSLALSDVETTEEQKRGGGGCDAGFGVAGLGLLALAVRKTGKK
jgi:hypothetical protein